MIETKQSSISYTADGVQTQWEFPYSYFSAADIKLFITQDEVRSQIAAENYTFDETTKKVTYPLSGDPVSAGSIVELTRQTEITQLEDSSVQNFKSDDVERIADKLTLISQEINIPLANKQDVISDLNTIRSNATAGKTAYDTIATYGTVVTHDASEFATAAQGAKADTAVQPSDLASVATSGAYNDLTGKPGISDLEDVAISSPSAAQVLAYDATTQKWKNSSSTASVAWGGVTGTLSDQTDLQNALDAKQATVSDLATIRSGASLGTTAVQKSGDTMTGDLTMAKNGTTVSGVRFLDENDNCYRVFSAKDVSNNKQLRLFDTSAGNGVFLNGGDSNKPYYWDGISTSNRLLDTSDYSSGSIMGAPNYSAGVAYTTSTWITAPSNGWFLFKQDTGNYSAADIKICAPGDTSTPLAYFYYRNYNDSNTAMIPVPKGYNAYFTTSYGYTLTFYPCFTN